MIIRQRAVILGLVFWLVSALSTTIPEPCPVTYAVWRLSLRAGQLGVAFRDLGPVKEGVEACDVRYR